MSEGDRDELRSKRVEVRMLEKENKKLEERAKFVRDVMLKEEKIAKAQLAQENDGMKKKMEQLEREANRYAFETVMNEGVVDG
jgi:hypothetical protein